MKSGSEDWLRRRSFEWRSFEWRSFEWRMREERRVSEDEEQKIVRLRNCCKGFEKLLLRV
jgi:hypothetical protein